MTTLRQVALGVALGLLAMLAWQGGWLAQIAPTPTPAVITDAAIVRETGIDNPLTKEQVKLYAGAAEIGVKVLDKDILGPGKQPSAALKPFLDAAKDKPLPVLVLRWPGGSVTVESCPATFGELKARVAK